MGLKIEDFATRDQVPRLFGHFVHLTRFYFSGYPGQREREMELIANPVTNHDSSARERQGHTTLSVPVPARVRSTLGTVIARGSPQQQNRKRVSISVLLAGPLCSYFRWAPSHAIITRFTMPRVAKIVSMTSSSERVTQLACRYRSSLSSAASEPRLLSFLRESLRLVWTFGLFGLG